MPTESPLARDDCHPRAPLRARTGLSTQNTKQIDPGDDCNDKDERAEKTVSQLQVDCK